MKKLFLICIFILATVFASCQSTPETEIVIGKDQDEIIEKIETSNEDEANASLSSIPTTWAQDEFGTDIVIKIDADIIVPDVNGIPVNVITADTITQDKADKLLDYFTDGRTLYTESLELTKDDYTEQILSLEANINDPDADWRQATKASLDEYESALAKKEQELENLKSLYSQAPETTELILADTEFHQASVQDQPGIEDTIFPQVYEINGVLKEDNGNIASIYIYNSDSGSGATYTNLPEDSSATKPSICTYAQPVVYIDAIDDLDLNMDFDSALSMGNDILNSLAINNFSLFDAGVGRISEPADTFKELPYCYVLVYTKDYEGVLQTYDCASINYTEAYGSIMSYEKVIMYINDNGLVHFEWTSPTTIVDTLSENTTLMDFDNIMGIFEKQILIQGVVGEDLPSSFYEVDQKIITIDRITLTMERIKKQDNQDAYLIVPAWNFYGSEVTNYIPIEDNSDTEDLAIECEIFSHSYLTINAIDGSIIDRSIGY